MNYKNNIKVLMFGLLTLIGFNSNGQNLGSKIKFPKTLSIGVSYQVQEFQLLNQTIDSDCNCIESLPLKGRSIQTYNLSTFATFSKRWAGGFSLGSGFGNNLNDETQYKRGDFFTAKVDAFYQLFKESDKLRPYLTSSMQLAISDKNKLFSIPVGAGLRFHLKNNAYLNAQAAYDVGLGNAIAKNLISTIGINFPLTKSKPSKADFKEDLKVLAEIKKPKADSVALANKNLKPYEAVTNLVSKPIEHPKLNQSDKIVYLDKNVTLDQEANQIARIVYFDLDMTLLNKTETSKVLSEIYNYMVKYPESKATLSGHTDGTASSSYNLTLSQRRAQAVLNHFVKLGILENRFVIDFFGKSKPATDNSTAQGKASNRRVEILVK